MKTNESKTGLMGRILTVLNNPRLTNLYIIILMLLLISFVVLKTIAGYVPSLYSDNAIYAHLTWYFLEGDYDRAVHIWWQPLYPFLGSLMYVFIKDIPLSLFYVSVVSGILLFVPIFLTTYEITKNRLISVFAGLLATFHLQLIKSFYNLLTENLFITLLMFCVLFGVYTLSRKRLIYAFIYGALVGITSIARSDVLLSYQIFLGFGLLLVLFNQINRSFYINTIGLSLLAFFIFTSPYLYFNYQKFGFLNMGAKFNAVKNMPAYFSPQNNLTTTYAQDVWVLEDPNYDSDFFHKPFPYWKYRIELWQDSVTRGKGYIKLFFEHERISVIYLSLIAFVASSIYFLKFFKSGLYLNFLLVLGFLGSLPFQPGVDFRYSFWMYPIFAILTAVFLIGSIKFVNFVFARFKNNLKIRFFKYVIIGAISIFFVMFYFNTYKNNLSLPAQQDTNPIYRMVGEYIGDKKSNAKIMTRREAITYFAKGSIVYIPSSIGLEELEMYAKLYIVDFIVADRETFPPDIGLHSLNDETITVDWLVPIKIWKEGFPKTILYQVKR